MEDEAMQELMRQAEKQAVKLENGAGPGAVGSCAHHGDLAMGVSLALRLQLVTAKQSMRTPRGGMGKLGAGIGIPAPVCALAYAIGSAKGWW